jgi:hypothetical protein
VRAERKKSEKVAEELKNTELTLKELIESQIK